MEIDAQGEGQVEGKRALERTLKKINVKKNYKGD